MTSHVQPEQTVCLKSLPKSKLDSTTVQGGDLSDEPVELRSVQTTPTKRKRDDEGNNTNSENDTEQDYKRRKIAQEAEDKEFAQALKAAEAADAEEADKQLAQALEAAEAGAYVCLLESSQNAAGAARV